MEVSVKSPHTLHVEVYEKGLLGYLYMDSLGQNVYFDKDGFVVEMSTDVIEGVPQITGLTCGDAVLYEKLDVSGKDTLKDLLAVTQTLKKYNLVPDTINYDDQGNVTLQYGTITVNLGQATSLTEKSSSYGENYAKSGRTYRHSSSGRLDRRYHRYYF